MRILSGLLLVLVTAASATAEEERPDFFRYYNSMDLAECLEQFKEREYFEATYARVFNDKRPIDMFILGLLYHHGLGTPHDSAKAVRWYEESLKSVRLIDRTYSYAEEALKDLRASGNPTSPAPGEALVAMTEAALAGPDTDQLRLATRYLRGLCTPLDWEEAMRWEMLAAENGSVEAQRIVVENFFSGNYAYPRDLSRALVWLEPLAQSGDGISAAALGDVYLEGVLLPRDYAKALELYEQSAATGNLNAKSRLHLMYREGLGVEKDPQKMAALEEELDLPKLLAKTAKTTSPRPVSEYAEEVYRAGVRHFEGEGEPVDYYLAGLAFMDAAGFGVEEADNFYRLGRIQEDGLAGEANPYGAGKCYRIAALLGHGPAMFRLGRLYEEGRGVRHSLKQAERWYAGATAANEDGAEERLSVVRAVLHSDYRENWEDSSEFKGVLEVARFLAPARTSGD